MHPGRLLEEEEEKLKQLMHLKEEQERYIERAQQEKQELQQEMAQQSRSLQHAQQQLEEVRQNRQRADEDVEVRYPAGNREELGEPVCHGARLQSQATCLQSRIIISWLCCRLTHCLTSRSEVSHLGEDADKRYHSGTYKC